ncbi:Aste57867_22076 [Aphanomyces stellatus]|uniref:Aste57867_22076 protein n=1 Tax=Aphanomyces stellatus TaxID=120398 RepID=A0A485LJ90_9STRA|nr:hypothetical protein As57867_022007 [Aphanomyces stellatus]VFT98744.1 Aste57867_22076 [Aphanomyces stellatus]
MTPLLPCKVGHCRRYAKQHGVCLKHFRSLTAAANAQQHHQQCPVKVAAESTRPLSRAALVPTMDAAAPRRQDKTFNARMIPDEPRTAAPTTSVAPSVSRMATLKTRLILRERLRQREQLMQTGFVAV